MAREVKVPDLCVRSVEIGRQADWIAALIELLTREAPRELVTSLVVSALDVLTVAQRAITADATTTAALQLPDGDAIGILLSADPANVDNVLLGIGGATPAHVVEPGGSFSGNLANTNLLTVASDGAGAVRVIFTRFLP